MIMIIKRIILKKEVHLPEPSFSGIKALILLINVVLKHDFKSVVKANPDLSAHPHGPRCHKLSHKYEKRQIKAS